MPIGTIRNDLLDADEVTQIFKNFKNSFRVINSTTHKIIFHDTTDVFKVNRDQVNGSVQMYGKLSVTPESKIEVYNDNHTYYEMFIDEDNIDTFNDWVFDYSGNQVTVGTEDLVSGDILNQSDVNYSFVDVTVINNPTVATDTLLTDVVKLQLITENETVDVTEFPSFEIPLTEFKTLKYKLVNTEGSSYTFDLFDDRGKYTLIKIRYY